MLVGAEEMYCVEAVFIVVILLVENADAVAGLVLDGVDVIVLAVLAAVISGDLKAVVLCSVRVLVREVGGNVNRGAVVLVVLGGAGGGGLVVGELIPEVRSARNGDKVGLIVCGDRVHYLDAGLVLVILKGEILVLG